MSVTKLFPALFMASLLVVPLGTGLVSLSRAAEQAVPAVATTPAAPAAAIPVAPPMPSATSIEKVDNPYGLEALWKGGDFVSRGTLIILMIMSMGSWYVLVTKLYEQWKIFRHAADATKHFWKAGSIQEGVNKLHKDNAFRFIAQTALDAGRHNEGAMTGKIERETWVTTQIQRSADNVEDRLQDGLALLATVGSTAPFVGLFGTVWGIYHALTAIGIAGQASIDKVAGPVGEALIMTAIGLAVAVPAVLGYNWLVRRNKLAMEKIRPFSVDVHSVVMATTGSAALKAA